MASLVDDILDLSRIRNQDLSLQPKSLDLYSLVDVVLRLNLPLIKGKSLTLENKVPQDIAPIFADENRLQQILQNLVDNGIKFTEKGSVSVEARPSSEPGFLDIQVTDTGIGIPVGKQDRIFGEFQQVDGSIQREYGGMGLGLSITRKLVELHGGKIWVDSTPGEGSSFFVRLPLAPQDFKNPIEKTLAHPVGIDPVEEVETTPTWTEPASDLVEAITSERLRILIVDDEVINHHVLNNHLMEQHVEIKTALNGQEALSLIEQESFDLVLLDVMMPRMSGYEVCQRIREKYLASELPVIMITAKNQISDLVHGLEVGANDYLAKPFSRSEFLARVKTHLNLHNIHAATSKFIPTKFLHSLGYEAITEVKLGDHVEMEVSVMFADIRDYTSLAESMTPTENFKFVNAFTRRMGPMIIQSGGFVNQYLGDCIMSVFPEGQQTEGAVNAAINMQKMLTAYNKEREKKSRTPVRVGIGIHTGPLILGIIGDNQHLEASTIADTVNTSARMESLTKHFGASIIVSENCKSQLSYAEQYNYRYLGPVQLKGKKAVIGIYEFFDGEMEEQVQAKFDSKKEFEAGMYAYLNKQFDEAVRNFAKVLQTNPFDGPATYFLKNAQNYARHGIPDNWEGIEMMRMK